MLDSAPPNRLLPTTLVGSYPQPDWLIDRDKLAHRLPPRVRAEELWRIPEPFLAQAQDDATTLAIRAQEKIGLDIITDGEQRRESYSNRFATALEGVDIVDPGTALDRTGHPNPVPRVVGAIRRSAPIEVADLQFLRASTDRRIKITLPGPFTMAQQAQNDYYSGEEALALGYAEAINQEVHDLFRAGADVVQLDEPYLQARPDQAREYGVRVINRALDGVEGTTALHLCFGYAAIVHNRANQYAFLDELQDCVVKQVSVEAAQPHLDLSALEGLVRAGKTIILGVLDLGDPQVESADLVAARLRDGLQHIPAARLVAAPDCGLKYLPRETAVGKLTALVEGAALVRAELGQVD